MVTIAVTSESADEPRVAVSPDTVKKFVALGAQMRIEAGAGAKVLAIAFNERCDVIVATALVANEQPAAFEGVVLAFLNGDTVLRWAEAKLGL